MVSLNIMHKEFTQQLSELFLQNQKCVILPHKNPDGDALGSTLALWHFFNKKRTRMPCHFPNEYPSFLSWLEENEIICFSKEEHRSIQLIEEATFIFTLDFNALGRIAPMDEHIKKLPPLLR